MTNYELIEKITKNDGLICQQIDILFCTINDMGNKGESEEINELFVHPEVNSWSSTLKENKWVLVKHFSLN